MRGRLISEPIDPIEGSFDSQAMSQGEPGLPCGFVWRGRTVRIRAGRRSWKKILPSPEGDPYLRRHFHEVEMEDGSVWTVYCMRQPTGRGGRGPRWFLYTVAAGIEESGSSPSVEP